MHLVIAFFIAISVAVQCQAEVVLESGSNETVTFDGDEVEIIVQNPRSSESNTVVFCFASTADAISELCPKGYLQHDLIFGGKKTLKVNRQGQLFSNSLLTDHKNLIKYDKNGNLNVMTMKMSGGTTVIMPKAEIYVPQEAVKETKRIKSNSNATVYIVIACVVVFLLALILISAVVYFCVIPKKGNAKPMAMVIAQEENRDELRDGTLQIPTSPFEPEIKIHTPKLSNLTPGNKPVNTATQTPLSPAKAETPESPVKATTPKSPVQPIGSPTKKNKSYAQKPESSPSPLDKTESAIKRRSPPTGTFSNNEVLSKNSHLYNARGCYKRSEASIPGSSRSRSCVVNEASREKRDVQ